MTEGPPGVTAPRGPGERKVGDARASVDLAGQTGSWSEPSIPREAAAGRV